MDNILLDFPPEQLSSEEIKIVREMIGEYKQKKSQDSANVENATPDETKSLQLPIAQPQEKISVSNLFCDEPTMTIPAVAPAMTIPAVEPGAFISAVDAENTSKENVSAVQLLEKQKLGDPFEAEALNKMIEYTKSADEVSADYIAVSVLGLIPCKKFIRHGTPEQKLFVLKCLGDRFLDGIAGIKWNDRRKLLKAVAGYLSTLSENYNFIPMEGEGFNPTLHERVLGASTGNIIKEMRGFLVVAKGTNRVTYAGVVLT